MALINCGDCGKEVSDTAKKCIHCGKKNPSGKKSGCFRTIIIIGIAIAGLVFIANRCSAKDEAERQAEAKSVKNHHCAVTWEELEISTKENILKEFMEYRSELEKSLEPQSSLMSSVTELVKSSIKYPSTLRINGDKVKYIYLSRSDAYIKDIENGIIVYHKSFTSENKLSQEVKGTFWVTLQYKAECENYKIIDFTIE